MSQENFDNWTLDQQFVFEGQTVRYGVSGEGSAALVFVHGWPFSSVVWRRIIPFFQKSHKIYVYDLLGYGQSEMKKDQDATIGVQSELLSTLFKHWGFGKDNAPDVIAHDIGGCTVLRAHLLNACDYRTLTLIDPVAVSPWGSSFVKHARDNLGALSGLPPYIHKAIVEAYIRAATTRPLSTADLATYVRPWLGDVGTNCFYRQIAGLDQRYTDEIEAKYGTIRCPVRVVWGENDDWLPFADGKRLVEKLPDADFIPVPSAGHLVQEDAPEAVVYALTKSLA